MKRIYGAYDPLPPTLEEHWIIALKFRISAKNCRSKWMWEKTSSNYFIMRIWLLLFWPFYFHFTGKKIVGKWWQIHRQRARKRTSFYVHFMYQIDPLLLLVPLTHPINAHSPLESILTDWMVAVCSSSGSGNNPNKPCSDVWKHVISWTNACLTYKTNE